MLFWSQLFHMFFITHNQNLQWVASLVLASCLFSVLLHFHLTVGAGVVLPNSDVQSLEVQVVFWSIVGAEPHLQNEFPSLFAVMINDCEMTLPVLSGSRGDRGESGLRYTEPGPPSATQRRRHERGKHLFEGYFWYFFFFTAALNKKNKKNPTWLVSSQ